MHLKHEHRIYKKYFEFAYMFKEAIQKKIEVVEKDANDDGNHNLSTGIDDSVESIDISDWYNLTYEEQVEAIGRYNADTPDEKDKYGSITVGAINEAIK